MNLYASPMVVRIVSLVVLTHASVPSLAEDNSAVIPQGAEAASTVVVGTRIAPPFVIETSPGEYDGITIRLLEQLGASLGLNYELRLTPMVSGLENGSLDMSAAVSR